MEENQGTIVRHVCVYDKLSSLSCRAYKTKCILVTDTFFCYQEAIHAKMFKIFSLRYYEDTHASKISHKLNKRNVHVNEKSELHSLSPRVKDSLSNC